MSTNHTSNLGRVREQVGAHAPVVCGAALKLALASPAPITGEHAPLDAGLTVYHGRELSRPLVRLAESPPLVLAPA